MPDGVLGARDLAMNKIGSALGTGIGRETITTWTNKVSLVAIKRLHI